MRKFNVLFLTLAILFVAGCGRPNFMGSEKWIGGDIHVERWFLNPDKLTKVPEGAAFYGAAADKIKDKFIIKYYIAERDGDSTTEIPVRDMWKVKYNSKRFNDQDDDDLFFYIKDGNAFKKYHVTGGNREQYPYAMAITDSRKLLPIKKCYEDGWCKVYPTSYPATLYVKRSILYQGPTILNEKEKEVIRISKIQATPAVYPWITPSKAVCERNGGEMNSRGVCQAKWLAARRICSESRGRLPTLDELTKVIIDCGGRLRGFNGKNNSSYTSCYRKKGLSHESNGYFSSTEHNKNPRLVDGAGYVKIVYFGTGGNGIDIKNYPRSILCRE